MKFIHEWRFDEEDGDTVRDHGTVRLFVGQSNMKRERGWLARIWHWLTGWRR